MWEILVNWLLNVPSMLGNLGRFFTLTLGEVAEEMPSIPGLSVAVQLWANLMPNVSLIGFLSVTGVLVALLILMIKKIWPFS